MSSILPVLTWFLRYDEHQLFGWWIVFMSDQDDATLVELCQKGDRGAFERLVEKYQKTVFNIALRITRNSDDAEDVAQTAFIRVYRNLHNYDPKFKFFSWLY